MVTPRKWPGRERPSRRSLRPSTLTEVRKPPGIHFAGFGSEEIIHAEFFKSGGVVLESAWILLQIFAGTELHRIHENRGYDRGTILLRRADQRDMAFVQRAHGGDEAEDVLFGAGVAGDLLHPFDGADDFHVRAVIGARRCRQILRKCRSLIRLGGFGMTAKRLLSVTCKAVRNLRERRHD